MAKKSTRNVKDAFGKDLRLSQITKNQVIKRTYRVSKIIKAHRKFAYRWLTDYKEDDPTITESKSKIRILEKTKRKAIYTIRYKSRGVRWDATNIVTPHPPRSWHLDSIRDDYDEIVEYRLTGFEPRKTRLDMVFKVAWKMSKAPNKATSVKHNRQILG